jgi:cell wall-associated NlpC family hydrolase
LRGVFVLLLALVCAAAPARADDDKSLGEKIKDFFQPTPTPTPHRHHHTAKKKSSPTPTPSQTPKKHHAKASRTPDESETPATKKHHHAAKASPTPNESPSPEKTPKPKKKSSPSPTPEESVSPSPEESAEPSASPSASPNESSTVASVLPDEIKNYDKNEPKIRQVLDTGLGLTTQNLKYTYGSADPANGGMDCSGFIYYVLRQNGFKDVPRDASGQYVWVRQAGNFRAVLSRDLGSFELDELKPGDLLFWTGTYDVEKDPPVTHTMIYLGKLKENGKPVMLGASDGRTFDGKQRYGVSVFDFKTSGPKKDSDTSSGRHPRFVGYGRIPGL